MKMFTQQERAVTLYVCDKCGRTADEYHVRDWLIKSRTDSAEAQVNGEMVIRCPQHITDYARRISRKEDEMRNSYVQYVHEYYTDKGQRRFAVARWDQRHGQYIRPFDATEAEATGCGAEFARTPAGVQNYASRTRALRRARYLFAPEVW